MRVLVAGATGVIGRKLVPLLAEHGHDVIAMARSPERLAALAGPGIETVAVDALARDAFIDAIRRARADAAVHLLSQIPVAPNPRRFSREMEATNLLRTAGSRNLLDGARAAGTGYAVAASLAFAARPGERPVVDEDAPLWADGPRELRSVVAALADLEQQLLAADGAVLRFGHLYGEGTTYAADGVSAGLVRRRRLPIVGRGGAVYSFTSVEDAAGGVLAALESAARGTFHVVDDEPAAVSDWLPHYAASLGAPAPRRVPTLLARLAVGELGVAFMTRLRGASNARAREQLGWTPVRPSWRDAFVRELTGLPVS